MISFLKKRWYLVLVVLLIGIFIVYKNNQAATAAKKVDSYKVKRENLKETLSLSGEIDAEEKVTLKFQTSGRLAWVGVKEGDFVKKYQTIASLDQRDLKNRLQKYLNTFVNSRLGFDQTIEDNWNKQYDLSQSVRDSAQRVLQENQNTLNNSVLDVESQTLSVEYANLWTPIGGLVTRVSVPFAGINITPSGAEFEIVNPRTLFFSVTAEQTDVVGLKEGMTGQINFDAFPDKNYQGTLSYISFSPKEGETGSVYEIRLKLGDEASNLPLKLGMTGDLDFLLKERDNVLAIPTSYLKKDRRGSYLLVGDKKEKRYVKTSEEIDGKFIITDGLSVGDVIYD
jgi:RND family efflux transporter MFP subunit